MGSLFRAIYAILTSAVAVPVRSIIAAQGEQMPFIVINEVTRIPTEEKDGPSTLDAVRIQIDIYSKQDECMRLAEVVRKALEQFQGTAGNTRLDGIRFANQFSTPEDNPDFIRISQEYMVRHCLC